MSSTAKAIVVVGVLLAAVIAWLVKWHADEVTGRNAARQRAREIVRAAEEQQVAAVRSSDPDPIYSIYHVPGCKVIGGSKVEHMSRLDAIRRGFRACAVCRPDEVSPIATR